MPTKDAHFFKGGENIFQRNFKKIFLLRKDECQKMYIISSLPSPHAYKNQLKKTKLKPQNRPVAAAK